MSLPGVTAGHRTVLLDEAVAGLNLHGERRRGIYVDGTFGRGGHSRAILEQLGPEGRLLAFDRDPAAIGAARQIGDPRLSVVHANYSALTAELLARGVEAVDGILLDLGVSSPQLDAAERGFSFRFDGPLDMRMDNSCGITAAEWLHEVSEDELKGVIRDYGEERFAQQIARAVVAARSLQPLVTTRQLAQIVAQAVKKREPGQDPATRTFQAIRIFLNQELEGLSLVMPQCLDRLRPGGRLAIISFHSLEDRMVKRFLRGEAQPRTLPDRLPVRAAELPQPRLRLVGRAIRAGSEEVAANPRARSATLRIGERT